MQHFAPLLPDAPDILNLGVFQRSLYFVGAAEHADALIVRVLFGQPVGNFGKRFGWRHADANGNAGMQADRLAPLPGILWQVEAAEARHIEKCFVDGIDFDLWSKCGKG